MNLDSEGNWVLEARQVISPNCDERPQTSSISLLVVHGISLPPGDYGGPWIDALFTNQLDPAAHPYFSEIAKMKVSAHVLIRRDGALVQYVPFNKRAWHAGTSRYQDCERCNDFSIGIELEGLDDESYEEAQYQSLAELVTLLRTHLPGLGKEALVGHSEIAPGRKTDPGPSFDWGKLQTLLYGASS